MNENKQEGASALAFVVAFTAIVVGFGTVANFTRDWINPPPSEAEKLRARIEAEKIFGPAAMERREREDKARLYRLGATEDNPIPTDTPGEYVYLDANGNRCFLDASGGRNCY